MPEYRLGLPRAEGDSFARTPFNRVTLVFENYFIDNLSNLFILTWAAIRELLCYALGTVYGKHRKCLTYRPCLTKFNLRTVF